MAEARRYKFTHAHRLHGSRAFAAVFDARLRKNMGPITVCGRANQLPHCRLGLSVSRQIGNAVKRNGIKRLLREAFRLSQHDWPCGYDLVVVVRPHETLTLAEYQKLLFAGIRGIHLTHEKRQSSNDAGEK